MSAETSLASSNDYGREPRHGLAPCPSCHIWHCPACGCEGEAA